jgi:hypothetical protein
MSEKENKETNNKETAPQDSVGKKQQKRFTKENEKVTAKLNEQVTGPQRSRGKKQRRQYKLAPNRG